MIGLNKPLIRFSKRTTSTLTKYKLSQIRVIDNFLVHCDEIGLELIKSLTAQIVHKKYVIR